LLPEDEKIALANYLKNELFPSDIVSKFKVTPSNVAAFQLQPNLYQMAFDFCGLTATEQSSAETAFKANFIALFPGVNSNDIVVSFDYSSNSCNRRRRSLLDVNEDGTMEGKNVVSTAPPSKSPSKAPTIFVCSNDAECATGDQVCDLTTGNANSGKCVACNDVNCAANPGDKKACDVGSGQCVECIVGGGHCVDGSDNLICDDSGTPTCVECSVSGSVNEFDQDCQNEYPSFPGMCDYSTKTCVECIAGNDHCGSQVCKANVCSVCATHSDCTTEYDSDPAKAVCDDVGSNDNGGLALNDGNCVECTDTLVNGIGVCSLYCSGRVCY